MIIMEKITSSIIKIQKKARQFLLSKKTEYLNRNPKKGKFECFSLQIHSIYDPFEIKEDCARRSRMITRSFLEFQVKPVLDLIQIFDQSKLESCISNKSQELANLSTLNSQLITSAASLSKIESELIETIMISSVFKVLIEPCVISNLLNSLVSEKTFKENPEFECKSQAKPYLPSQNSQKLVINTKTNTSHNYSLSHIVNPSIPEPRPEQNHSARRHSIQLPKISTFFPEKQEKNKLSQPVAKDLHSANRFNSRSFKPKSLNHSSLLDVSKFFPSSNENSIKSNNLIKNTEMQKQFDKHASLPDIHHLASKIFINLEKPPKQSLEADIEPIDSNLKKKHKTRLQSNSTQGIKSPKNPKLQLQEDPLMLNHYTVINAEEEIKPASVSSNPSFTMQKLPTYKRIPKIGKKFLQVALESSPHPKNPQKVRSSKIKTILKQGKIP